MMVKYNGRDVTGRLCQLRDKTRAHMARGEHVTLYPTEVLFLLDLAEHPYCEGSASFESAGQSPE